MPKFRIITCPYCKKEFEEEVLLMCGQIPLLNYNKNPEGIYTRRSKQKLKPRLKECPFCKKSISINFLDEDQVEVYRADPILKKVKDWFQKFLP